MLHNAERSAFEFACANIDMQEFGRGNIRHA